MAVLQKKKKKNRLRITNYFYFVTEMKISCILSQLHFYFKIEKTGLSGMAIATSTGYTTSQILISVVLMPPTSLHSVKSLSVSLSLTLYQERPPPNEGQRSLSCVPRGGRISQAYSVTDSGPIFKSGLWRSAASLNYFLVVN